MPYANPLIRDEIVIDGEVSEFCRGSAGDAPVFLLARRITHTADLTPGLRPVILVCDEYDGGGHAILAAGAGGGGGVNGANGAHVGESGAWGGDGGAGGVGGTVTVYCRSSSNAHVVVRGGNGGPGGYGGNGANGTPDGQTAGYWDDRGTPDDTSDDVYVDPQVIPGIVGGRGGHGGRGGAGGGGGVIRFTSISDTTPPALEAQGGGGSQGGWGGYGGTFAPAEDDGTNVAPPGDAGDWGADGEVAYTNVSEADFVAGLWPVLGIYANYWAPFRLVVADWLYHRNDHEVPAGQPTSTERAAIELRRTLELQPDNAEALRLQRQLESGVNALGLDPELDVLPIFNEYASAFLGLGSIALGFVSIGANQLVQSFTLHDLAGFAEVMRLQAVAARDDATGQVALATTEHRFATDEIPYAQQRLDQASADITAEMERMRQAAMKASDGTLGTIAEVAVAVVGVIAAVPSGGASLVALVPAVAGLASTVLKDAGPLADAVLNGTDADVSDIKAAYKKIGKDAPAEVVAGGKSIINFVSVVEKLTASTVAPDDSKYVALVRRGVELTHELLLAQRRADLAQQRIDVAQQGVGRAQAVADAATSLHDAAQAQAATLRQAALVTLDTAGSSAATLGALAFRASRAVEIYTLQDEGSRLHLDVGMLTPDFVRDHEEGRRTDADLVGAVVSSWGALLAPAAVQGDYLAYFDTIDTDQLRVSFAPDSSEVAQLRGSGVLSFTVDLDDIPHGRYDAKVIGARIALVGASHPNGQISTQLRHGARHQQRRPDGTVATQLLASRSATRQTGFAPLSGDPGFTLDAPVTDPTTFRLWGRGLAGPWEMSVPADQLAGLDLDGLSAVQVWFGYRFLG